MKQFKPEVKQAIQTAKWCNSYTVRGAWWLVTIHDYIKESETFVDCAGNAYVVCAKDVFPMFTDYVLIIVYGPDHDTCEDAFFGQLSDGLFENYGYCLWEEVSSGANKATV